MNNSNNSNNSRPTENQVNAGDFYGLSQPVGCSEGACLPNAVGDVGYTIPSIQDIASFNQSTILPPNSPQSQPAQNQSQMEENQMRQVFSSPIINPVSPLVNQVGSMENVQALERIPAVEELENVDMNQPPIPQDTTQTPATVFGYGATMDNGLRNSLGIQITDYTHPYPVTAESIQYLNGFIRTQIGRRVTIDFLVGSNSMVTKSGYLLGVAANYILINELDTNDITTCDFYNIKFIRFYY